ncbi:DUF1484 domain-containing protein [Ralstonia pseudosolanacearum]|uniref:DUF1484 domain-containing protein n=1 Tax=Ralstonia pseudosolanacearum TaxID=1310165 RepID=UPI002E2375AD
MFSLVLSNPLSLKSSLSSAPLCAMPSPRRQTVPRSMWRAPRCWPSPLSLKRGGTMGKRNRTPHWMALEAQRSLTAELAQQTPTKAQFAATLARLETVSASVRDATEEVGAQLLCVSAALDGILCLLDLHAQTAPGFRSLHCLLVLVKQQLDGAIGTVTDML